MIEHFIKAFKNDESFKKYLSTTSIKDIKTDIISYSMTQISKAIVDLTPEMIKRIFDSKHTISKHPSWYVTESLCELCKIRLLGCEYQYDSEQCIENRKHYLNA